MCISLHIYNYSVILFCLHSRVILKLNQTFNSQTSRGNNREKEQKETKGKCLAGSLKETFDPSEKQLEKYHQQQKTRE